MNRLPPIRSWLYAPGSSSRLLERVFDVGADAVILDLEDSVRPEEKATARRLVGGALRHREGKAPPVFVRINHPRAGMLAEDLGAALTPALTGIRVPKVESVDELAALEVSLGKAELAAGLSPGSIYLVCGIESAAGVAAAVSVAGASPRVAALSFGVADYLADVGGRPTAAGTETLFARAQLVIASRLAGIGGPVDSVHVEIDDEDGLRRSCREGRALGFSGRGAIHPRQVPIINAEYTPSPAEVAAAQAILAAAAQSDAQGAFRMANGEFVDAAIVRRARRLVELDEAIAREQGGKR